MPVFGTTDDEIHDAFGGVVTPLTLLMLLAATRLKRHGCVHRTDRLIQAEAGISRAQFFRNKLLLVANGWITPNWGVIMPSELREKARAQRRAVKEALLERVREWRARQRRWIAEKKTNAQLAIGIIMRPTINLDLFGNELRSKDPAYLAAIAALPDRNGAIQ